MITTLARLWRALVRRLAPPAPAPVVLTRDELAQAVAACDGAAWLHELCPAPVRRTRSDRGAVVRERGPCGAPLGAHAVVVDAACPCCRSAARWAVCEDHAGAVPTPPCVCAWTAGGGWR